MWSVTVDGKYDYDCLINVCGGCDCYSGEFSVQSMNLRGRLIWGSLAAACKAFAGYWWCHEVFLSVQLGP